MPTALGRMHALRVLLASTAARVEALRAPCASWASSKRRLLLVHRAQSVQPVNTAQLAQVLAWFVNRGCSNRSQPKARAKTAMLGILPELSAALVALRALLDNLLLELAP